MISIDVISILLIWTLTLTYSVGVMTSHDEGEVLGLISNLLIKGEGNKIKTIRTDSLAKCVMECYMSTSCESMSYSKMEGTCHINSIRASSGVNVVAAYDENYVYTEIPSRKTFWQLVFRATEGIGVSVYDAWNNVGHSDDVTSVTANDYGCLTVDGRLPCDKHFRSWRLDDWNNIDRVWYGVYTNARSIFKVVMRLIDDRGATETFDDADLTRSYRNNFEAYNGSFNYISVEGYSVCHRRFYINQVFGGACAEDYGWMMVSDGDGGTGCCSYETTGPYPQFFSTKTGDPVNWNNQVDVERANVFAVLIRYKQ